MQHDFCVAAANELIERLDLLESARREVAVLGSRNEALIKWFRKKHPEAAVHPIEHPFADCTELNETQEEAHSARDTESSLPLDSGSVDLVISNLSVTFYPLQQFASESFRILSDGGILLISALGPDSFREIRMACTQLEDFAFNADFGDMHNFADLLLATGFKNPVVDADRTELNYSDISGLVRMIEHSGFADSLFDKPRKLSDRATQTELLNHYPKAQQTADAVQLSMELFYGIAWKQASGRVSAAVPFHAD